ncbi:MAG: hypothetical protein ACK4FL_03495 [Microgenomates group bacterium]
MKKLISVKNFLTLSIFLLILSISFYASYNLRYYLRFGDEVGHWYVGSLILKNKKIYNDIFSHHQPIIYYLSAITESIFKPENLYKYIGIQRMSIFFYSFFWNILLFIFFRQTSLIFIFIFEFIKLFFLGYQNLGETLAVYPFVFIIGNIFKEYIYKKTSILETIFFCLAFFLSFFSLLPLWPIIAFLFIFKFFITRKKNRFILILLTFLSFFIFGFIINYKSYIKETIFYNIKYYIPSYEKKINLINFLIFPFQSLLPPYDDISILTIPFTLSFLYILIFSFKKDRKFFYFFIFLTLLLYLSNTRDQLLKFQDFPKFHMLPWIGYFYFLIILSLIYIYKKDKKITRIFLFLIIVTNFFLILKNINFFKKRDFLNDFYINYSESEKYGKIINVLKDKNDTLLVIPNDPLIYYLTNINPPIRIVEYYPWMEKIKKENDSFEKLFKENPPDFIVDTGLTENGLIGRITLKKLSEDYLRINHLNKKSNLYIYKNKLKNINNEKLKKAKELLFEIEII